MARRFVTPDVIARPHADRIQVIVAAGECLAARELGARSVEPETNVPVLGDIGISNTPISAALAAAIFGGVGSAILATVAAYRN